MQACCLSIDTEPAAAAHIASQRIFEKLLLIPTRLQLQRGRSCSLVGRTLLLHRLVRQHRLWRQTIVRRVEQQEQNRLDNTHLISTDTAMC